MSNLFEGFEIIVPENIKDYYKPGVWAMFGVPNSLKSEQYDCLNVGKNICIGEELQIDYERLKSFALFKPKRYVNQFNQMMFSYPMYADRQDYLYKEISEQYHNIVTIIVTDNPNNTYTVEKYFAYTTEAKYWVSNGRYKSSTKVDTEEIRKKIDVSDIDNELIKKIDAFGKKYKKQREGELEL